MISAEVIMSPVKRERLKKAEKLKLKKNMRAALPVLNNDEIRRFRIPYYEAVLLELDEQGFTSSAEFLNQLIQYQEDLRKEHGPDSAISARPRLLDSRHQLDILYDGLKNAEGAHYVDDIGTECDHLIKMGAFFGLGSQDWWWLGEQLLIQAVNVSAAFQKDGGRREATSKYIFGKFILENLLDPDQAKQELIAARQISIGKAWNAKREMGALLAQAKEIMNDDPLKAARICAIAKKRATDACDHKGEAEALMLQGICEMEAGDASAAVISFTKVLVLHIKAESTEGICEARIHLALAYLKIGKFAETLNQLEELLAYAELNNLPYYVAQAHRFLGEYYLNQGTPNLATPLLIKALHIFHELEDMLNREQARNLAAISAGQELIAKYIALILKCGKEGLKGHAYVLKLVRWKDTRELFWTEGDETSIGSSFEQSLMNLAGYTIPQTILEEGEGEFEVELTMIKQETDETVTEDEHSATSKIKDEAFIKEDFSKTEIEDTNVITEIKAPVTEMEED